MSAWTRPKRAVHMGSLAGSAMVAGGRQGGELSGNVSALLGRVMYLQTCAQEISFAK